MAHIPWQSIKKEELSPAITRQYFSVPGMTVARVELKKGARVPMHRHVNAQLCEVRAGALRFFYEDGKQELIKAGECLFLAPDVPHEAHAEEDSIVVDVFTPERADWAAGDDAYLRHK